MHVNLHVCVKNLKGAIGDLTCSYVMTPWPPLPPPMFPWSRISTETVPLHELPSIHILLANRGSSSSATTHGLVWLSRGLIWHELV